MCYANQSRALPFAHMPSQPLVVKDPRLNCQPPQRQLLADLSVYDRLRAAFRLALRRALAFARRRCSLLDMNHLFLRRALSTPLLVTALRQRLSSSSCDSPGLKLTDTTQSSSLCDISSLRKPPSQQ
jgi:hypothetical protein